jgi:hypothetical protein
MLTPRRTDNLSGVDEDHDMEFLDTDMAWDLEP